MLRLSELLAAFGFARMCGPRAPKGASQTPEPTQSEEGEMTQDDLVYLRAEYDPIREELVLYPVPDSGNQKT